MGAENVSYHGVSDEIFSLFNNETSSLSALGFDFLLGNSSSISANTVFPCKMKHFFCVLVYPRISFGMQAMSVNVEFGIFCCICSFRVTFDQSF